MHATEPPTFLGDFHFVRVYLSKLSISTPLARTLPAFQDETLQMILAYHSTVCKVRVKYLISHA
jgi:hypothetical protein